MPWVVDVIQTNNDMDITITHIIRKVFDNIYCIYDQKVKQYAVSVSTFTVETLQDGYSPLK